MKWWVWYIRYGSGYNANAHAEKNRKSTTLNARIDHLSMAVCLPDCLSLFRATKYSTYIYILTEWKLDVSLQKSSQRDIITLCQIHACTRTHLHSLSNQNLKMLIDENMICCHGIKTRGEERNSAFYSKSHAISMPHSCHMCAIHLKSIV